MEWVNSVRGNMCSFFALVVMIHAPYRFTRVTAQFRCCCSFTSIANSFCSKPVAHPSPGFCVFFLSPPFSHYDDVPNNLPHPHIPHPPNSPKNTHHPSINTYTHSTTYVHIHRPTHTRVPPHKLYGFRSNKCVRKCHIG